MTHYSACLIYQLALPGTLNYIKKIRDNGAVLSIPFS